VGNRQRLRDGRGQSLVEFAVLIPIFLAIVMGMADFGLGLKTWIAMTNSAREAARYASVNCAAGTATAADVQQRAVDAATDLGLTTAEVSVDNCTPGASAESVIVTIDHDYQMITPLGGFLNLLGGGLSSSISLTSRADMRME
jgi:Flp pilus assembly protein TadG